MEITIKETCWNTGAAVQANDIVFAWRRILDPNFDSPAASMLYCIKGARKVKSGEISFYDPGFGLYTGNSNKIIVEFEEGADINEFLYNLASPALVPLMENKVSQYPDTWSRSATDLCTNGPFRVKKFSDDPTERMILERSKYYYLNQEVSTEARDKYVTPYQIHVRYDIPVSDVPGLYNNEELFYISGLTAAAANSYTDYEVEDLASAFMFYFNFKSEAFEDATIRKAFSMALDRDAIAATLGLETKPATGILNDKIYDTKKGTSFREEGGNIVKSNRDEAKALLANAGIDPSDYDTIFVLICQDEMNSQSNEKLILDKAFEAWMDLGFDIDYDYLSAADFEAAYKTGAYDIIGMDYQMISAHALYDLAMFSSEYSKTASLLKDYTNETFDNLLAEAFQTSDLKKRAEILHTAENALIEDGALIPVVFNTNAYVVSSDLKQVKTDFWGVQIFTKANLKNYVQYLDTVKEEETTTSGEEEPVTAE